MVPVPEIDLGYFQGTPSLLLQLIERKKLSVTEVSVAQVAERYLLAVQALPMLHPDLLADFVVMVAQLMFIKSLVLLRQEASAPGEAEAVLPETAPASLSYGAIKRASGVLAELESRGLRCYLGAIRDTGQRAQLPLAPLTPEELREVLLEVLARLDRGAEVTVLLPPRVSLEERISYLLQRLAQAAPQDFDSLAGQTVDEKLATLLGALELAHQGRIEVEQTAPFGQILLRPRRTL